MNTVSEDNIPEGSDELQQSASAGSGDGGAEKVEASAVPLPVPRKKRLIRSISLLTTINYMLFCIVLLVIMWGTFFVGMYAFYDRLLKNEMQTVGNSAVAALPKNLDSNSATLFYKVRLPYIAMSNSVAAAVFSYNTEGELELAVLIDSMGNTSEEGSSTFILLMEKLSREHSFTESGRVFTATDVVDQYLCFGLVRTYASEEEGVDDAQYYLLLFKPYEKFDFRSSKLVFVLVLCSLVALAVGWLFAFISSRFQNKRIRDFSQKAKRLAAGDYTVQFDGDGYNEYELLAHALNDATAKTERNERLQREIVANVSHDIRTPLTMIRAYAEMLRDMPLENDKRERTAGVIISEAERLTVLTEDMLDLSRLQSGVIEFRFEPCDISRVAEAVLTKFDIFRERDGIVFVSDIDKRAVVSCDEKRIQQVLYNLIINAINYCGADKQVAVSVKAAGERVRVEVADHGKGIDSAELDYVWERYYRTARGKRQAVGSGLGLSICKNILVAHGADYGVVSQPGEGTTFWFELPAVKAKRLGGGRP